MTMRKNWLRLFLIALLGLCVLSSMTHAQPVSAAEPEYHAVLVAGKAPSTPSRTDLLQKYGGCKAGSATQNATLTDSYPHLAITLTATGQDGTPITEGTTITRASFPYAVTYTIEVKNTGTAAMSRNATTELLASGSMTTTQAKPVFLPLPQLQPGQSKVYTRKVVFSSGDAESSGDAGFEAYADAYCQIAQPDFSESYISMYFHLRATNVDLVAYHSGMYAADPNENKGDGLIPGQHAYAFFYLSNLGSQDPTQPVVVQVSSALIGKSVKMTILAAQLPKAGTSALYKIADQNDTPIVYTIKATKQQQWVPFTVSINTTHTQAEDTFKNNTLKGRVLVVPTGVNLYGIMYFHDIACPRLIGPANVNVTVYNGGTEDEGAQIFVQLTLDGKPVGQPLTVPGLGAGQSVTLTGSITVNQGGFHTIGAIVDSRHELKEYNERDNTATLKSYFYAI